MNSGTIEKTKAENRLTERYRQAKSRRSGWEVHWRDAYDHALPQREGFSGGQSPGDKKMANIYDATAADAVDQLSASLLSQLTPPWSRWFGLSAGTDLSEEERAIAAPVLERTAAILQSHFDRSNFTVEVHQCFLDLVTGGTASLLFEEAPSGEASAFRFTAVPLYDAVLEEGPSGRLDTSFRRSELTMDALLARFPGSQLKEEELRKAVEDSNTKFAVLEEVRPAPHGYQYRAVLESNDAQGERELESGLFETSPFINFRWLKAPGENYGRSPVMKVLPDIKTANKVVELVLKNASIAVTGIWQADDDGVLNPANIKLTPGTIIPKAVGSKGLTPLEAPGRFDVSQLVLEDLRARIRHALLIDRLGQVSGKPMTATEVLERSNEMARILGATYGRLQSELLTPLVKRAVAILSRRGEIPDVVIDGRAIEIEYRSPLAQDQARKDARNTMLWLDSAAQMGPQAMAAVDVGEAVRWMARSFGVPENLLRSDEMEEDASLAGILEDVAGLAEDLMADDLVAEDPVAVEPVAALTGGGEDA